MFRKLTDWVFGPEKPPKEKYNYSAPPSAINVGPVVPGWPAYLRIWHDTATRRIKFEFRNMPNAITAMDEKILPELIVGLRILQDNIDRDKFANP